MDLNTWIRQCFGITGVFQLCFPYVRTNHRLLLFISMFKDTRTRLEDIQEYLNYHLYNFEWADDIITALKDFDEYLEK